MIGADQKRLGESLNHPVKPVHPQPADQHLQLVINLGSVVLAELAAERQSCRLVGRSGPQLIKQDLHKAITEQALERLILASTPLQVV